MEDLSTGKHYNIIKKSYIESEERIFKFSLSHSFFCKILGITSESVSKLQIPPLRIVPIHSVVVRIKMR